MITSPSQWPRSRRRPRLYPFTAILSVFPLLASFASAQAAPVPAGASAANDEPVVLSPFEVLEEEERGYLAGTVQSGTRLRMDLRDTAASISVVTKDFMKDIGANNLEDLLLYTLGTEVGGASGNFSDAGVIENPGGSEIDYDNAFGNALPSTRVRGLTAADVARDFFVSSIPPDGYNVERKEISRGANAMLFGLGSPAGIINASLSRANFQRRKSEVELQFDKYGSYRGSFDHNEVVLKNKLGVRVASMYEDNSYKIEEAWEEDRRGYITAGWRPFRHTTVRASFEAADIESNRPDARPPGDAYTHWWALGKPVWNMNTGTGSLLGTPEPGWPSVFFPVGSTGPGLSSNIASGQIGAAGNGQFQMHLIYNNPLSSQMNIGIPGVNAGALRGGNVANVALNPAGTALVTQGPRGLREMNAIYNRVIYANTPTANYWKATQITDPAIYDFYNHMLHGQDKFEWAKWNTYNASIEQLLLDGRAGIELAANREKLDNGSVMPLDSTISGYTLRIDINTHLWDGTPNPNFGRVFTDAYSKLVRKSYDRDTVRATGFYDFDFRKTGPKWLGDFLGRHRVQADHTRMTYTSITEPGNFFFNSGLDYYNAVRNSAGVTQAASTASRGAVIYRYLGPNVSTSPTPATGAATTPVSQWPANITTVPTYFYQSPTTTAPSALGQWEVRDFTLLSGTPEDSGPVRRNVAYTREKVNSSVVIAQGYWLQGKLVSTVGVRRDHVQTYNAGTVLPQDRATGGTILDERFYPRPVTNLTVDTVNWGVVGHAPERIRRRLPFGTDLSLFYNVADNFRPAGQRYDIFDNAIPHEEGETEDYGVVLSTLEGKLRLRFAKYETTSAISSSLPGSNLTVPLNNLSGIIDTIQTEILRARNAGREAGIAAWNTWYNGPTGQALRKTFRVTETPAAPGADPATADVDSIRRSGEVVAPSDVTSTGEEYELHFKPTRSWDLTFNANRAQAVRSNVATALRKVVFDELKPLMDGPAGDLRGTTDATNTTQLARTTFTSSIYNQMLPRLAEEGLPTSELREWHWNLITNYRFVEGRFSGFNVGGAIRWQDKIAIGAPIIDHPLFGYAPDVRNPHYGPTETNYDAWIGYRRKFTGFDWRIQLNVRNIGVGEELIPVGAQPDGSIAGWRVAPEETWRLTTTFTF